MVNILQTAFWKASWWMEFLSFILYFAGVCSQGSNWQYVSTRSDNRSSGVNQASGMAVLMMMSSNGNIFRITGPLCGEFTGHQRISLTKGQWRAALVFSLICAWTMGWINNRNASDLKHHHAHYDFIVMFNFVVCIGWQWPCTVRCPHTRSIVSALVEVNLPVIPAK